jgi:DNA-binding transcriptional MerR regulator
VRRQSTCAEVLGARIYYQHHEVLMVRRIRELLYDQGFTISGARNHLSGAGFAASAASAVAINDDTLQPTAIDVDSPDWLRNELLAIKNILDVG